MPRKKVPAPSKPSPRRASKKASGPGAGAKKPAAKKAAAKKPAGKKVAVKKAAVKKAAAKKPAVKKAAVKKAAAKKPATRGPGRRAAAPQTMLAELRPQLLALSAAGVAPPVIPVERLVAEGVELAAVAWRDLAKLGSAGLDRQIVIELGKRSQALAEAQAELAALRSTGRTSEEEDLIAESTELRSEVLAAGRLALRHDAAAGDKLAAIAEGDGVDDLLQDLQDLAAVLRGYVREYTAVGLKPVELASWAEELRGRLGRLVVERRLGDEGIAAAKDLRDRAASYLLDAIRLTRLTGAYVFRKEPRKLLQYRSGYNAGVRRRQHAEKPAPTPASDPPSNS